MQEWCAELGREECVEILGSASIGCGPVLSPEEVAGNALELRQTFMREVAFPDSGSVPITVPPARLSSGTVELSRPPLLGEHTDEVLRDYGYTDTEIAALRSDGTV